MRSLVIVRETLWISLEAEHSWNGNSGTLWGAWYNCPCTKHLYPSNSDLGVVHAIAEVICWIRGKIRWISIPLKIPPSSWEKFLSQLVEKVLLLAVLQEERYGTFLSATFVWNSIWREAKMAQIYKSWAADQQRREEPPNSALVVGGWFLQGPPQLLASDFQLRKPYLWAWLIPRPGACHAAWQQTCHSQQGDVCASACPSCQQ